MMLQLQFLKDLGAFKVNLMTNNPRKIDGLESHGIEIVNRVPIANESQ